MTELYLNSSIDDVSGVGPKVKVQLEKLGIESVQDALFFLPKSYENRTKITQIKDLEPGGAFQVEAVSYTHLTLPTSG